jgi:hypothetical protein
MDFQAVFDEQLGLLIAIGSTHNSSIDRPMNPSPGAHLSAQNPTNKVRISEGRQKDAGPDSSGRA